MNSVKNEILMMITQIALIALVVSAFYIDINNILPLLAFEIAAIWCCLMLYVNIRAFHKYKKEEREEE